MLEKMDREGRTDPNERMLTYTDSIQLSRVLKRVAERAGIKHGNKKVRFHCLRKFLTDRLSSFMSESKWKQIVGKTVSESAYVSPDSLREDYKRAMSETTFKKTVSDEDRELEIVETMLKSMGLLSRYKVVQRSKKMPLSKRELIEIGQRIIKEAQQQTATNGGRQNGNCQRIVSEEELPSLLEQGWHVAAVLPSGKIVVESNG